MLGIWIITQRQNETYGHGDFGQSTKLPTLGPYDSGDFHPAFLTEQAALDYIKTQDAWPPLIPTRLEVRVPIAQEPT